MDWKAVGHRIQAARKAKNMTQEQFAAALYMSTQHISALERGIKPPSLETLVSIANTLEVSADNLLQDVVDCSALASAGALTDLIALQPAEMQRKITRFIEILVKD